MEPSRLRWVMIGLAFLATVINYLDRQALSVIAPVLREEFNMSNEAYGYVLSAFMLAYTVSNGLSGPLLDRFGTRLGYAGCMAWWFVYHIPAHVRQEVAARPAPPWRLLRTRFLSVLTLSKVFLDPVWYFYSFWFPQYLKSVHGFDLAKIGMTAWIPFVTADIGNLVGGWLTGRLIGRGWPTSTARKTVVAVFAILMTSAIPAILTSNVWVSVALISVATFGYTGYNSNALAFPPDVFPKNMVASVWGLASMGSGFGGMLFSWLSGRMIDQYGYTPVFIAYGIMPLIAAGLVLFAMGPLRPLAEFQDPLEKGI